MTDWDDGDPGDIDTLTDEAYAAADQERKRLRENWNVEDYRRAYPRNCGNCGLWITLDALDCPRCLTKFEDDEAFGYSIHGCKGGWVTVHDLDGTSREVPCGVCAQPSERAADAENTNQRGDEQ